MFSHAQVFPSTSSQYFFLSQIIQTTLLPWSKRTNITAIKATDEFAVFYSPRLMLIFLYIKQDEKNSGRGKTHKFLLGIPANVDLICGSGRSVGIETDYGLDGPRSNTGVDEIFRPSRPALGPTQPPVKWVPSISRG
jgi:hypothetical protein